MGKKNRRDQRGRDHSGPAFVQLYKWILATPAWQSLNVYSRCLYVEMRRRYNGQNNGAISMSHREAAELLGCSNKPVMEAFRQLQERGFIAPVRMGGFDWKAHRDGNSRATTWRLTELSQDDPIRSVATQDFKAWQPPSKKVRYADSTPMVRPKHTIDGDVVCREHTIGMPTAHHNDQNAVQHGVPRAYTSNIPYGVGVEDTFNSIGAAALDIARKRPANSKGQGAARAEREARR